MSSESNSKTSQAPRIVYCGYRDWAQRILEHLRERSIAEIVGRFEEQSEFEKFMDHRPKVDFVVFAGWSWVVPKWIIQEYLCMGLHPSDLPKYRGGSPLQHQIIDGLVETKLSLFLLDTELDTGAVIAKAPMSLEGTIQDIFDELVRVGTNLFINACIDWPNLSFTPQNLSEGFVRRRRKPQQSRMERADFQNKTLRQLYDFIRALGDPYPNAYLEDDEGNRLLFKNAIFQSGKRASQEGGRDETL